MAMANVSKVFTGFRNVEFLTHAVTKFRDPTMVLTNVLSKTEKIFASLTTKSEF